MATILALVINEMMKNAAKEIRIEHCEENIDQIIFDMDHQYDIQINMNGPITAELMETLSTTIMEWKRDTAMNYKREMQRG